MDKKIIIWIVIGILFLVALYLIFQLGSGGSIATQNIGSTASSGVSASSSSGMVGGC